jgi:hypothetical protein
MPRCAGSVEKADLIVILLSSLAPRNILVDPAPHRFNLLRVRVSEETIVVQEICAMEEWRWSLPVPETGLPEDMVHMLEELEKLAVELVQALPKIVVTYLAESLLMKRTMERDAVASAVNSLELLRRPPAVGDESSVGYDSGTGLSLAKDSEENRIVDPERVPKSPAPGPPSRPPLQFPAHPRRA